MSMPPRLTIGIPTYNFGDVLGATLQSVTAALPDDVEVLIVDGGSTDGTPQLVAEWMARHRQIRYHRKASRDGIDVDMALVVELARADYCWLLSADDTISPDAVATVLAAITSNPDVVLLSHSNCDSAMREIHRVHPVLSLPAGTIAIADAADRERYFAAAATTEALFSFMSGLVVRRATWRPEQATDLFFPGSCWSHAARLLTRMRDSGMAIRFIDRPLVQRRGENDSFAAGGVARRYALAIDGYRRIVSAIFGGDSQELEQTTRVLRREFGLPMFLYARRDAARRAPADRVELDRLFSILHARGRGAVAARLAFSAPPGVTVPLFEWVNAARHRFKARR
ncbi:glycosyltransferase family 2 protein [Sphingomonas citri]